MNNEKKIKMVIYTVKVVLLAGIVCVVWSNSIPVAAVAVAVAVATTAVVVVKLTDNQKPKRVKVMKLELKECIWKLVDECQQDDVEKIIAEMIFRKCQTIHVHKKGNTVAFSHDRKMFAYGEGNTIKLLNTNNRTLVRVLDDHEYLVTSIAFSLNGMLVSGSDDGAIKLWRANDGTLIRTINNKYKSPINAMAISPNGDLIASGREESKVIELWNANDGLLVGTLNGHSECVRDLAFSHDGELLTSGSVDGTVKLWNSRDLILKHTIYGIHKISGYRSAIYAVSFSPSIKILAFGGYEGIVYLYDIVNRSFICVLNGHRDSIQKIIFSPNGEIIASGSDDGTVKLWNTNNGTLIRTLNGHSDGVRELAFSPDGELLASGSNDATVKLWKK